MALHNAVGTALPLVLGASLLLAACAGAPAGELSPEELIQSACARDGGWRVHDTARVAGFTDRTQKLYGNPGCTWTFCKDALRKDRYAFIEAEVSTADIVGLVPEPGLYRFTLQAKGHPACAPYERWLRSIPAPGDSVDGRPVCIATEKITEPRAAHRVEGVLRVQPHSQGYLHEEIAEIREQATDRLLAEYRGYRFHWNARRKILGCEGVAPGSGFQKALAPVQRE